MPVRIRKDQWPLFNQVQHHLDSYDVDYRITPKGRDVVFASITDYDLFESLRYSVKKRMECPGSGE